MSVIDNIRDSHTNLAEAMKEHLGIRKIVEDLYPDSAHFIYELLQNAEDTGATKVNFLLRKDSLVFAHNGRAFNERDIKGITDIGDGSKGDDCDSIGQFGIGFKAVFAYSETPRIWSPTYSFEIKELVLPFEINTKKTCGEKTCFEFPFNNPKKDARTAYSEILEGLNKISHETVLFLSNISVIEWQIEQNPTSSIRRKLHFANHIEIIKKIESQKSFQTHYLCFSKPVEGMKKQNVSLAFELELYPTVEVFDTNKRISKQFKISPANPGHVSVFFPAEKETSGLRFHIHAPFVPELSRASIKQTPANNPLFIQLADLAAESLHTIKDIGLLNTHFLEVLPNNDDVLSDSYVCIKDSILNEFNTQELTPTYEKSYSPANMLIQATVPLKKLLTQEDISLLIKGNESTYEWAIGATKNTILDKFLKSLGIINFSNDDFYDFLREAFVHNQYRYMWIDEVEIKKKKDKQEQYTTWLQKKPTIWLQKLYAFLFYVYAEDCADMKDIAFIKTIHNEMYTANDKLYFLQTTSSTNDFNFIKKELYTSGDMKKEQDDAKSFLEIIGVSIVDEKDEIKALLKDKYESNSTKQNIKDVLLFIEFIGNFPEYNSAFNDFKIIKSLDGSWRSIKELYLDEPFIQTHLINYLEYIKEFKTEQEKSYEEETSQIEKYSAEWWDNDFTDRRRDLTKKYLISSEYLNLNIDQMRLIEFFKTIGIQYEIEIINTEISKNKKSTYLRSAKGDQFTEYGMNQDYTIMGLDVILNIQDMERSKIIWRLMSQANLNVLKAIYKNNKSHPSNTCESTLVQILRDNIWVPQTDGTFVSPSNASKDLLPDGFAYDSGSEWLKAVEFGEKTKEILQEKEKKQEFAKELGFQTPDDLKSAQAFISLPKEERDYLLKISKDRQNSELPEHAPRNPELRSSRVGEQATKAPDNTKTKKERSVSDNDKEVKLEADGYLRQQYINDDEEIICQICSDRLPFKNRNGKYHMVKIKFIPTIKKLHYQNYLSLCPNHAAMYKMVNDSEEEVESLFRNIDENHRLPIKMDGAEYSIYFTQTHILDMNAILNSEEE